MGINFTLSEFEARLGKVRQAMGQQGIDGLLVFSPENMYYLTGYDCVGYILYQVLIVSAREPELTMLLPALSERVFKETSFIRDYRMISSGGDPLKQTADILEEKGLTGKVVGIEKQGYGLTVAAYESLVASLSGRCTIADASDLIAKIRLIKSFQEVEYVKEAGRLADLATLSAFSLLREGMTEFELCGEIERALVSHGSGYPGLPLFISSGPRAPLNMYCNPSNRKIKKGDMTSLEFGGVCNRYHAVLSRTVMVGAPQKRVVELYESLQVAIENADAAIKPGIPVGEVHSAIQDTFDRRDTKQQSGSWGYGIGLGYPPSWLEIEPNIAAGGQLILQPGMVFFLYPYIMLPEEGIGLRLGDTFLVTEEGHERITNVSRELAVK